MTESFIKRTSVPRLLSWRRKLIGLIRTEPGLRCAISKHRVVGFQPCRWTTSEEHHAESRTDLSNSQQPRLSSAREGSGQRQSRKGSTWRKGGSRGCLLRCADSASAGKFQ